jgi:hypothetical protein
MTTTPTISLIRATTYVSDAMVISVMNALQKQISGDFAKAWGTDAKLIYVEGGEVIPNDTWQVWLKDHSDEAGALGYHDLKGNPIGYAFIGDCLRDGVSWTVDLSHEVHEMLVDPTIDKTVIVGDTEYALESDDTCEDDRWAVSVDGHLISNSATPAWFNPLGKAPFTIYPCSQITKPLDLGGGGYIGTRTPPLIGVWGQRLADGVPGRRTTKGPRSRTVRRFTST